MADVIFLRFLADMMNKVVDLEADTINLALVTTAYVPDQADNQWDEVGGPETNEASLGAGYTAGGAALANKVVTQADPTKWDNTADISWLALTGAFRYGVIYDISAAKDLICLFDFGAQSVTAANVTVIFNAAGIVTLTPP